MCNVEQKLELRHLIVVSALIVSVEKVCASGNLPENDEQALRALIARVCRAYDMPTVAERPFYRNATSVTATERGGAT